MFRRTAPTQPLGLITSEHAGDDGQTLRYDYLRLLSWRKERAYFWQYELFAPCFFSVSVDHPNNKHRYTRSVRCRLQVIQYKDSRWNNLSRSIMIPFRCYHESDVQTYETKTLTLVRLPMQGYTKEQSVRWKYAPSRLVP
eukprot:1256184-Pyramimonas_sp.AAC.1